jgi:ATP-dependent DNA helicase PIF1
MNATILNDEQRSAHKSVQSGKNIFLTGAGGTGKSHTIRAITEWARDSNIRYAVTAMTGCAALLLGLGAKTLHSWAGIGLARESPHELAKSVQANKRAARRWIDTQLLIVDEVSMMTPELLEKLDLVARRVRKRSDQRFGGLQVILAGDFCQLPPVQKGVDSSAMQFVFESSVWKTLIDETHYLHRIERQRDPVFQRLLTETRLGHVSQDTLKILEERMNLPWQENEIRPTLLFTRNAEVDTINRRNMDVLEGEQRFFEADTVVMDKTTKKAYAISDMYESPTFVADRLIRHDDPDVQIALERLDTDAAYEKNLELRVGAQVMLIVNMDQDRGLVNGSRGVLTGYTPGGLPIVRFLAIPEPIIVDRANWWLTDYEGIGRTQIPLKVAYALTIHKSQGSTLDSALIDIGSSTFEYGQAYVALSRVRTLFGLYVWKLDPRKIRCHPKVKEFYEALQPPSEAGEPTTDSSLETQTLLEALTPLPSASLTSFAYVPPTPAMKLSTNAEAEEQEEEDPSSEVTDPWILSDLSPAWNSIVEPYMKSSAGQRLRDLVVARSSVVPIMPSPPDVFQALQACPDPTAVRVVILGQDPYHTMVDGEPIAHGLAFSVREGTKIPPSLLNIYKEIASDLECPIPTQKGGCLSRLATQGVFLLNDVLTVSMGQPQSHCGIGWEDLTAQMLATVLKVSPHVVVLVWGRNAQKKLDHPIVKPHLRGHTILKSAHPSPLSAHNGFFGSRPFSQANAALIAHGQAPIDWTG